MLSAIGGEIVIYKPYIDKICPNKRQNDLILILSSLSTSPEPAKNRDDKASCADNRSINHFTFTHF